MTDFAGGAGSCGWFSITLAREEFERSGRTLARLARMRAEGPDRNPPQSPATTRNLGFEEVSR